MSIYGPPKPPPGRRSGRPASLPFTRADVRTAFKLTLWFSGFLALIGITVAAYTAFTARGAMTRELESAEAIRRAAVRAAEAAELESAERLPPLQPPTFAPPEPLQSAEILTAPAPAPASPARLQSAELIP